MTATADMIRRGMHPGEATTIDRDDAIKLIREALKRRSGKPWSVTGGRGTAWGWITIQAPPARRVAHIPNPDWDPSLPLDSGVPRELEVAADEQHGAWYTSEADCRELADLLNLGRPAHCQGMSIPAASDYRRQYIALARGLTPTSHGVPYWD